MPLGRIVNLDTFFCGEKLVEMLNAARQSCVHRPSIQPVPGAQ